MAGNTTPVGSSGAPAKEFSTNVQKVTGISISPSSAQTKNIGDTFTITPTISPNDANNKNVNWTSTNTAVADFNGSSTATTSSGNAITIKCKAAGTATITATAADGSGETASLTLTVNDKVVVTSFGYSTPAININQSTSVPSKSITGTAKSGPTYSSSNANIATVNSSTGVVTGISAGLTTITISYISYDDTISTKTCNIMVCEKVQITSFKYDSASVIINETSNLPTVTITGTAESGPTYSSSNTNIATVNASTGTVTGISAGTATIIISYTNYDGSISSLSWGFTIKPTGFEYVNFTGINTKGTPPTGVLSAEYGSNLAVGSDTSTGHVGIKLSFSSPIKTWYYTNSSSSYPTSASTLYTGTQTDGSLCVTRATNMYTRSKITLVSGEVIEFAYKRTGDGNSYPIVEFIWY